MRALASLGLEVLQTLLRVLPFPCEPGLVRIGSPGRRSPVLLTGNYRLTVERVKRALRGIDAHLLVANSRGINVWCAATGGLLTNHDVVAVLKTSGIADLVDHRQLILPQLAATGIEPDDLEQRSGWDVVWGPVDARSIPAFLRSGLEKTLAMRTVTFPWPQRLEMAVSWAFPISLLALLVAPFWAEGVLPLVALVWAMAGAMFLGFPLYERQRRRAGKRIGFVFFDFGERGVPLLLWALLVLGLAAWAGLSGELSWLFLARWGFASLVVLLVLSLDLEGNTPVYKSGLHEDRLFEIALDPDRCDGAGFCEEVCPRNVFALDRGARLATLERPADCVQCGACIVQCPFDALFFRNPAGDVVPAQTIRRFKLNLLGTRKVKLGNP